MTASGGGRRSQTSRGAEQVTAGRDKQEGDEGVRRFGCSRIVLSLVAEKHVKGQAHASRSPLFFLLLSHHFLPWTVGQPGLASVAGGAENEGRRQEDAPAERVGGKSHSNMQEDCSFRSASAKVGPSAWTYPVLPGAPFPGQQSHQDPTQPLLILFSPSRLLS